MGNDDFPKSCYFRVHETKQKFSFEKPKVGIILFNFIFSLWILKFQEAQLIPTIVHLDTCRTSD